MHIVHPEFDLLFQVGISNIVSLPGFCGMSSSRGCLLLARVYHSVASRIPAAPDVIRTV
jgi:hypothetical protein